MKSGVTATLAKPTMLCAILAIACAAGGIASAQTFPNRPIRIVVGFAPAGPADVMARHAEGADRERHPATDFAPPRREEPPPRLTLSHVVRYVTGSQSDTPSQASFRGSRYLGLPETC